MARLPRPALDRRAPCPTCRTPVSRADNPVRPFCSPRCQRLDLASWLAERHRVPGPALPAPAPPLDATPVDR